MAFASFTNNLLISAQDIKDQLTLWSISPAFWSQLLLLLIAFSLARILTKKYTPTLIHKMTPPPNSTSALHEARRFLIVIMPLSLALCAYIFTAIGEYITRSLFDSGAFIALGKRVFLFLAAYALVNKIIKDPFFKLLGKYILLPAMALYVLGLISPILIALSATQVGAGNLQISLLTLLQGIIWGGTLFWLGKWSTGKSKNYIGQQEELKPATKELASKTAELVIFGFFFLLLMNIVGADLTTFALLGGAIGVGVGFGLQQIASNFISGIILLLEGQATVGDYVELDGGEAGKIVKMTARAAILETWDGKWIVVPNEHFITTRVINYSDSGSANRYEAPFSVSYDTDINRVPAIIEEAVSKLDFILTTPDGPDCELRGFGDSGVDFAVEFWVNGLDDGKNKFTPKVLFAIWNALKENNIEIPYPHRVIEFKAGSKELLKQSL